MIPPNIEIPMSLANTPPESSAFMILMKKSRISPDTIVRMMNTGVEVPSRYELAHIMAIIFR